MQHGPALFIGRHGKVQAARLLDARSRRSGPGLQIAARHLTGRLILAADGQDVPRASPSARGTAMAWPARKASGSCRSWFQPSQRALSAK